MPNTNDTNQHGNDTRCEWCDAQLDRNTWHPVHAGRTGDDTFDIHHFCSTECREQWLAANEHGEA